MIWVAVKGNPVPTPGKYVVKTIRPHYALPGRVMEQKLEAVVSVHTDSKGKEVATWHVANQVVTHYLWEV